MPPATSHRFRDILRLLRLLLVAVAVGGQCGIGASVAADLRADQLRAVDRAMVLCQPGHRPGDQRAPAPHRLLHEVALLQARTGSGVALAAAAPALPRPRLLAVGERTTPQQPRAPPSSAAHAAYPRGPPVPV
ncbi:MAG TPA: hypothetical protein VMB71_10235 [Acetobacteraceae bacterium]|nr:hypothetical protein [Acetobacteraceae bacterium]